MCESRSDRGEEEERRRRGNDEAPLMAWWCSGWMQKVPRNNEHQHSIEREHAFGWRVYFYILFICKHKQQQQLYQPSSPSLSMRSSARGGQKEKMKNEKEIEKTIAIRK
jgi:hypothetical protein